MTPPEKILIAVLPSDAVWLRLRDKFADYDIEADSEDDNVYDLRAGLSPEHDEVFYWGRDGWSDGFWHARIYLTRDTKSELLHVWAERGTEEGCLALLPTRKRLLSFMESCLDAREHNPEALDL